ncbi:MAG: molybdopterin converting factor, subunit 1 [Conexibacter sp.]|nr:molybdopterin converting factor, subunit 1 [Conexibacter sp.]
MSVPRLEEVRISVRLFAGLRERAGADHVDVDLPEDASVGDLLAAMTSTPVGSLQAGQCVVAINRTYATARQRVRPDDEVALIPPVSGGGGAVRHIRITPGPLYLAALSAAVRDERAGAVVIFEGVTREVPTLSYEAYADMAHERLHAIAEEVAASHGLCAVAVEHRTGDVALGEPSVIVAASAPHRPEAFAGARAIIDRLKSEAPIWKVETAHDGTRHRVEGILPSTHLRSDIEHS